MAIDIERYHRPLTLAGILALVAAPFVWAFGIDLYSYWVIDLAHPYATISSLAGAGVFRYSPPVALLMYPLRFLPWEVLHVLWLAAQLASLWYIGRRWMFALILFPPVWLELVYGNINIFIAAAVVAGLRHPLAWLVPLLTKVTPGVGVLWFLGRRDWRGFGVAVGVLAAIVVLSVIVQGTGIWQEWIASLVFSETLSNDPNHPIPIGIVPRVAIASLLTLYAGWSSKAWLVPIAVTLAMPSLWPYAFTPLVALPFLGSWSNPNLERDWPKAVAPTHDVGGRSVKGGELQRMRTTR